VTVGVVGLRKSVSAIVSSRDAKGVVEETRSGSSGWDSGAIQGRAGDLEVQHQNAMPGARAKPCACLVRHDAKPMSDGLSEEATSRSSLSGRHQRACNDGPRGAKNQSHASVAHPPVVSALNECPLDQCEEDPIDECCERAEVAGRELEFAPQRSHQAVGLPSGESPAGDEVREVALNSKKVVRGVHAQ